MEVLKVTSNAFDEGAWIPVRYTARGENLSPDFKLTGINQNAKSIAITMDDASHPIFPTLIIGRYGIYQYRKSYRKASPAVNL